MQNAVAWTGLAVTLIAVQALADEPRANTEVAADREPVERLSELLPETTLLSDGLLDENDMAMIGPYSTRRVSAFDVEFLEGSAIERLGRYRALSLVTFAEVRGARLFLGVNEDGLLGVHLNAASKPSEDRTAEVLRMPYLARPEPAANDDRRTNAARSPR